MTETRLCPRCGSPMEELLSEKMEEETTYEFKCPSCGMEFEAAVPDEKPVWSKEIADQGFGKCPFCGNYMYWNADFMRSEITGEELSEEEDTLVQNVSCPVCGTLLTAYYPVEEM